MDVLFLLIKCLCRSFCVWSAGGSVDEVSPAEVISVCIHKALLEEVGKHGRLIDRHTAASPPGDAPVLLLLLLPSAPPRTGRRGVSLRRED